MIYQVRPAVRTQSRTPVRTLSGQTFVSYEGELTYVYAIRWGSALRINACQRELNRQKFSLYNPWRSVTAASPQQKPTLWEETLLLGAGPTGERSGPPPRLAVEGRSSGHGPMLPISDVDKVKPMLLPHGGWPMAAGPASRLGSIEPGEKTGLRLSPTPST